MKILTTFLITTAALLLTSCGGVGWNLFYCVRELPNTYTGVDLTKPVGGIDRQASKFESRISDAPRQEKEFMTISRQQEIKAAP